MHMPPRCILITRPREDAEVFAAHLAKLNISSLIEPLLQIEPILPPPSLPLEGVQAVLVTSANGIRALVDVTSRRDFPIFTVGQASAAAAKAVGFSSIASAGGDVHALAALVRERLHPKKGHLLHVAGTSLAGDLVLSLKDSGYDCRRVALYQAIQSDCFSPAVKSAFLQGKIDAVALFSPRTAAIFANLFLQAELRSIAGRIKIYALSKQVAAQIDKLPWLKILVAKRPDQDAMISLVTERLS